MDNPLVQLDPGLFVWTILTFLLLFALLAKFAWKPLLKALSEREEKIRSSLEQAEEAQQKLEQLVADGRQDELLLVALHYQRLLIELDPADAQGILY